MAGSKKAIEGTPALILGSANDKSGNNNSRATFIRVVKRAT
jgi:hypothetical protein